MRISEKRKTYHKQFDEHLTGLKKSLKALLYSYKKCGQIGVKNEYEMEEQESFEALTARFARTSDLLTQKVVKSLFIFLQEEATTTIDSANLLEKLEIIKSADDLLNVREIRNQIAHEYVLSDVSTLYADVMLYVPTLENIVQNIEQYFNNLARTGKPKEHS